jgi:two-component system, NtrC family, nitrogen regulation response regulator NtrX
MRSMSAGCVMKPITRISLPQLGAFDFIENPPDSERILIATRNALGQKRLAEGNRRLKLVFDDR